jgi:hypothetical protein
VEKPPGVFIRNARSMTHLPLKLASLAALLGAIISLTLASVSVPVRLGVRDDARAPSKFSSPAMSTLGTALSLFPLDDRSVVFRSLRIRRAVELKVVAGSDVLRPDVSAPGACSLSRNARCRPCDGTVAAAMESRAGSPSCCCFRKSRTETGLDDFQIRASKN